MIKSYLVDVKNGESYPVEIENTLEEFYHLIAVALTLYAVKLGVSITILFAMMRGCLIATQKYRLLIIWVA